MIKGQAKIGSILLWCGRRALPALISIGLIIWLIWTITPQRLMQAISTSNWPWLVVATGVQVIVLFLWDTYCVWWLFGQPDRSLPFREVFRLRCDTVIWSTINLEIGQAAFAWRLSKTRDIALTSTLGSLVLLSTVDVGTLLSLALVGSFLYPSPLTQPWRWLCIGGLVGLGVVTASIRLLPDHWHHWLAAKPWASWLNWVDWHAVRRLCLMRLTMFLLVLVYAGAGLAICRVYVSPLTVVGIIPFVLLAESLPGTAGLGERETALVYLYPVGSDERAVLLGFGLIWSTVVILGRVVISVVSWCLPHGNSAAGGPQCAASTTRLPREYGDA